jgi:hypothetical protein
MNAGTVEADMKIYCDTNALLSNIKEAPTESAALERLLADHHAGKIVMCRSQLDFPHFRRRDIESPRIDLAG